MNVLFVSPHFPPNFKQFIFRLRDEGARVFGIGDSPFWEVPEDVRGTLTEYVYVPDMINKPEDTKRAVDALQHRYGKMDRVESHNEHWLAVDAQIRQDFDIFGQKPKDLEHNRSKMGMKEVFRRADVPVAPGMSIKSLDEAKAFVKQHGFPVVIKPDIGVGAGGARRFDDLVQLEQALTPFPGNQVIELYVRGQIYSYDGITDRDGNVIYETSHVYSGGIMEIVAGRLPVHYYSLRVIPELLKEHGLAVINAFEIRERFFHIEFFRTDKEEFYALEINVRPPGGFTLDMMNYASEIDLYKIWARLVVHDDRNVKYKRKFHVAHIGRRAEHRYLHDQNAVVSKAPCQFRHHAPMPPLWAPVMGDDAFLIGDPDLEQLMKAIEFVEARS